MAKRFRNEHGLIGFNGEPIKVPLRIEGEGQNAVVVEWGEKTYDIFKAILMNAPTKTQNDCIQGVRVFDALEKGKDAEFIELEEEGHTWIKPQAEQLTPAIFRFNGHIVYDFVKEGFEKAKQPKDKIGE